VDTIYLKFLLIRYIQKRLNRFKINFIEIMYVWGKGLHCYIYGR